MLKSCKELRIVVRVLKVENALKYPVGSNVLFAIYIYQIAANVNSKHKISFFSSCLLNITISKIKFGIIP